MLIGRRGPALYETIDRHWFEIYFGRDWPLFSPALDRILARKRLSFGQLSWLGSLFPVPALLYRRLWVYGLGLLLAIFVAGLLHFHPGAIVGVTMGMGLTLRSVVFDPAAKRISAILARSRVASDAAVEIAAAGRPSMAAAVLGAFLYADALYAAILGMLERPLFHPATISILVSLLTIAALGSVVAWVKINNPRYLTASLAPASPAADTRELAPATTDGQPSFGGWWRGRWQGYSRSAFALVVFSSAAIAFLLGLGPVWEVSGAYSDPAARTISFASGITVLGLIASALVQLVGGRHVISFAVGGLFVILLARREANDFMDIAAPAFPGPATLLLALLLAVTASALVLAPNRSGLLPETAQRWPWRFKGFLRTFIYLVLVVVVINVVAMFANAQAAPLAVRIVELGFRLLYASPPALVASLVIQALFGRNRVSLGVGGVVAAWAAFALYSFFEAYERDPNFFAN